MSVNDLEVGTANQPKIKICDKPVITTKYFKYFGRVQLDQQPRL